LEGQAAIRARPETPQAGEPRFFSLAQAAEYFLNHPVQAVGRLAACPAGLAGHLFGNFRLLHPDFTLATRKRPSPGKRRKRRHNRLFFNSLVK
jgi:hypothetical protein